MTGRIATHVIFRVVGVPAPQDLPPTMQAKVAARPDGCWHWVAARTSHGYGVWWDGSRTRMAHRAAYELLVGDVGDLVMDHLCRVRHCINPSHLEPVTHRENILRGVGAAATHAAKTHCPQGHPYAGENVYTDTQGRRRCATCRPTTSKTGHQRTWDSCKRGHPFDDENTYRKPDGRRSCRTCRAANKRRRRAEGYRD